MIGIGKFLRSLLTPEIENLKGQIKALDTKIDEKFKTTDGKIDNLGFQISALDEKIDFVNRIGQVEERLAKLESKN